MSSSSKGYRGILIKGGKVLDPAIGLESEKDVLIEDGTIKKIDRDIAEEDGLEVIRAKGLVVTPGLIDMHVHLREPGREDEETIASGTDAAAAGGFTAVACLPNTEPPIDNAGIVRSVIERAQGAKAKVYPIAAITKGQAGAELTEMGDLVDAGAVGFSDDGLPVEDASVMRNALEYSGMFNVPILTHSEIRSLTQGGHMNEGRCSSILGIKGMPREAEELMIARDISLVEKTKGGATTPCRLHVLHVSTKGSVELIREAKKRDLPVTCEVTPHHFTLTEDEVMTFNTNSKMSPPLRTAEDIEEIRCGLSDGTIDAIATDHAPHSREEKETEFEEAPFGILGLETALGLVITQLVEPEILSLSEAIYKMTVVPARILGIEGGELRIGGKADVAIMDPNLEWTVDVESFKSLSKNSPFDGMKLKGRAVATILDGEIVHRIQ